MPFKTRKPGVIPLLLILSLLAGLPACGNNGNSESPPETSAPTAQPGGMPQPSDGLWVTLDVGGDRIRTAVTQPETIQQLLGMKTGQQESQQKTIPVQGKIVKGQDVNPPWSWHLDPASVQLQSNAPNPSSCSAKPSDMERNKLWESCESYSTQQATLLNIEDCRNGTCKPISPPTSAPSSLPSSAPSSLPSSSPSSLPSTSPSSSPTPFDPCGVKACGETCHICPPHDPSCVETLVVKTCTAQGKCQPGFASCP